MNYQDKTKDDLIKELHKLQQEYSSLKTSYEKDITNYRKVEEALHVTETCYRELFNNISSGVAIFEVADNGNDFIFRDFNRTGERLDGDRIEDIIGKSIFEASPSIEKFGLLEVFRRVFATGIPEHYLNRFYKDEKVQGWYNNFVYRLTSGEIIAVYDDITEQKRAERALLDSEEKMRYIVKHDPNAIAIYDHNLHYIAVSDRYLQDYNVKEEDVIGKHHYEVFPEMPQKWKDVHQRCLAGGIERNDDDYFERPDGSITYNRWECRPWKRLNGEIGGIVTYTEVTTERKRADETIRVLSRFPSENPNPVLRVDRSGRLLFANEASYKFLTWKLQIGKKTPSVLQKIIAESLKEGIGKIIETENNQRIFSFNIIPIVEFGYANLYGRDITGQKQAEEAMIQQNNALSMLSDFSVALSMMSSEDSLEKLIVKRIKEFTGAEMATFSGYNPESRTLTIKHIELKPGFLEKGVSLIGKQLDKIQFVVNDEMYREIITNPIGKQRTLFEVSFGAIPRPVGEAIKALLKADRFIAIAYTIEGKLYATSVLAMSKDQTDPPKEILKNFIFLASVSLQRKLAEVALLSASRRLELALHAAKAGTWEWDIATDHMEWSPQIFDLLKLDSRTTAASIELWRAIIHPEDIEPTICQIEKALKQRTMLNIDYRVVLQDGQTSWMNTLGEGVYDNQGRPISMIGISMKINKRKLDEEALHLEKENFRYSLDDSPLGVIILSAKGKTVYANKTILNFYGYDSLRELQKTSIKKRYTSKSYAESQKRNHQRKLGVSATNYEISIVREDGEIRHFMVFRKEILWNDIWQFQDIYEDITQRKQGEEEIKNMKESMANMHQHLDEIRENERALISREIHDQIGQSLTALKIDLSWFNGKMSGNSEENAKLKGMIDMVDALSLDIHRISSELRPPILDDLGLAAALEWYCEEFANRTGLKVQIEIEDVQTENLRKNLSLYRVAQELLTNIIRHSGAKTVRVILRKTKNDIVMSIQDDGIGISPDKVRSSKSLGFLGMFERVKQSAGNMEIKTPSKGGTSIRVIIPIK